MANSTAKMRIIVIAIFLRSVVSDMIYVYYWEFKGYGKGALSSFRWMEPL